MKGRFCPKCGSSDKPFYKGFCIDCYVKDHPEILQVGDIILKQCPKCLRVFSKGKWASGRTESIEGIIASKVKTLLKSPTITTKLIGKNLKKETYEVAVSGKLGDETVTLTQTADVLYQKETCNVCSRKSGNYYEALVQLRPHGKEVDLDRMKSAMVFLRNEARALVKKDRNAEIFRHELAKNGIDIYFGSLRVAKIALQHLQATYHPKVKESYTLTGLDRASGKKRYRVTFSVRL